METDSVRLSVLRHRWTQMHDSVRRWKNDLLSQKFNKQKTLSRRIKSSNKKHSQGGKTNTNLTFKTWLFGVILDMALDKTNWQQDKGRQGLFIHEVGEHRWLQSGAGRQSQRRENTQREEVRVWNEREGEYQNKTGSAMNRQNIKLKHNTKTWS